MKKIKNEWESRFTRNTPKIVGDINLEQLAANLSFGLEGKDHKQKMID